MPNTKHNPAIYTFTSTIRYGPMSRALGDVYHVIHLSPLGLQAETSSEPFIVLHRRPLHCHPGRVREACRLIVHLSWDTSHCVSSVTSDTLHDRPCAPLPPIGWKV